MHPEFNPLTSPLSMQPSKKRLREINEEYFSNKRSRSDSMDTNYDLDSDTEEKELELMKLQDGYNQDGTVFYTELNDGTFIESSTEKWRGSPPLKLYPLEYGDTDVVKQIESEIVYSDDVLKQHPLEGIVHEKHFDLWEEEKAAVW